MRFTPRRVRREVNVSPGHPLQEFFLLAGGILGGVLLLYVGLGMALDRVVPHVDPSLEDHLGTLILSTMVEESSTSPAQERFQELLDELVSTMEKPDRNYRVHLVPSPEVNALALPGGHIVLLAGLVREASSENELTMILGHELGHFRNRDHLRGLGRGLVLVFLSSLLFGSESSLSRAVISLLDNVDMRFSRQQELQADAWGLAFVMERYGHAGGATDFFLRLAEKEKGKEPARLFASHPFPEERIEALEEMIRAKGYPVREAAPLAPAFLDADFLGGGEEP